MLSGTSAIGTHRVAVTFLFPYPASLTRLPCTLGRPRIFIHDRIGPFRKEFFSLLQAGSSSGEVMKTGPLLACSRVGNMLSLIPGPLRWLISLIRMTGTYFISRDFSAVIHPISTLPPPSFR